MRHAIYGDDPSSASVAILVKESSFNSQDIKEAYIDYLGANPSAFLAYSLWYDDNGKCPAALAKDYLQTVLLSIQLLGIKTILVTDATYFKYLTESKITATSMIGYHTKSKIADYDSVFDVWYAPNYQAAKYNPKTGKDLTEAIQSFKTYLTGTHITPGSNIIHSEEYPETPAYVEDALARLLVYPELTIDIETRGLEFWNCGIATIAFAWDKHNFIAIAVDRGEYSTEVKKLLRDFFVDYRGKIIYHNGAFDMKVLTYELFMKGVSHEDLQTLQQRVSLK
jgi:DNA polymerase-1